MKSESYLCFEKDTLAISDPFCQYLFFGLFFQACFFQVSRLDRMTTNLFTCFFDLFFLTVQIPAVIATIFIEKENSCSTYVKYSISIQLHFAKDTNISNNYNTSQSQMLLKSNLPTDAYH